MNHARFGRCRAITTTVVVGLLLAACGTTRSASERVAADTAATADVDPIAIRRVDSGRSAPTTIASARITRGTGAATTTLAPEPTAPTTVPPVPPPTAAPAAPPVTAAPTTPAPRTTAPAIARTTQPTAAPVSSDAPVTSVPEPTAAPLTPADDAPCASRERDSSVTRADGSTVTCTRRKADGKRKAGLYWTVQPAPTTTPSTRPAAPLPTAGFDGRTIRIGVLSTTTHPVWGTIGKVINAGIEARVAAINRRGGIAGRYPVETVFADTNYDPAQTTSQLQATKDRVVGYVSILGTPNVEAVEPLLRQSQLVAGPASQEARWALSPSLLPVGNSYQVQAINGISYFLDTVGNNKATVCGASVATSFGDAGSEGIRFAQERLGFTAGPIVQLGPTENQYASAIGSLKGAGCQAVFVTVGPAQTLGLVLTARALGFAPRWIIMGASFSEKLIVPATGPLFEQGAWVVGDGTQWGDTAAPGMGQLTNELIASNNRYWTENPDVGLTYGWTQARVMEAVLERAVALGDLSHAGVLSASQQIGAVDTLGLVSPIDYSQPVRLANARTTIFAVDGSYRNAVRVIAKDYSSAAAQSYRK